MSAIDSELWAFIKSVTRSISERRGRNVKTNEPDTLQHHVKQVRCLFCLCTIMFCTDDRCSVPFHTLITDTIESCGGSTQLIRILNRLGVCSSADTLARHIQCKVKEREERGPEQDCARNVPTIISADNIDFQHSYARIFCGEQTSSWHGTTVQAVQTTVCSTPCNSPGHSMQVDTPDQQPVQAQLPRCTTTTHGDCTFASSSDIIQHRNLECVITSDTSRAMATRKRCLNRRSPYKSYRSPLPKIK